tara:strand:+ start:624 stop:962 length:339 start_codon:yes stop_codon:yes gene_type:complete
MAFKMKGFSAFTKDENKQTKNYVEKKKSSAYGSSAGYESTTFGKGGRKGDKKHKEITLTKREGDKPTYIQTKRKKGKQDKTKVISEKKYKRKLARKTAGSIRRGDDTVEKNF